MPSKEELAAGWSTLGDLAVSPKVDAIDRLPMPSFDERYIYNLNINLSPHPAFVNRMGFGPLNEEPLKQRSSGSRLNCCNRIMSSAPDWSENHLPCCQAPKLGLAMPATIPPFKLANG
jgi:hypothetical protein